MVLRVKSITQKILSFIGEKLSVIFKIIAFSYLFIS